MKNITKRDIRFFLFGVLSMFLVLIAYNWEHAKMGFMSGAGLEYKSADTEMSTTTDKVADE